MCSATANALLIPANGSPDSGIGYTRRVAAARDGRRDQLLLAGQVGQPVDELRHLALAQCVAHLCLMWS